MSYQSVMIILVRYTGTYTLLHYSRPTRILTMSKDHLTNVSRIQPNMAGKYLNITGIHTTPIVQIYTYTHINGCILHTTFIRNNGYDVNSSVKVIIEAINTAVYLQQSFVERTPLEFHTSEC